VLLFDPEGEVSTFLQIVGDRTTRRHIPEDSNLHSYSCDNLKYKLLQQSVSVANCDYVDGCFHVVGKIYF
jgi:hypothetical protein